MNQDLINRLVVGPSISVVLGHSLAPTAGVGRSGLRLEGGGWVSANVKQAKSANPRIDEAFRLLVVLGRPWRKALSGGLPLGVTAAVALIAIAATCAALFWPKAEPPSAAAALPIAPLPHPAVPPVAVKIIPESYESAPPLPATGVPLSASSGHVEPNAGEIAGKAAPASAPARVPAAVAPSGRLVSPAAPLAAPAEKDKNKASAEEKVAKAIVLDDAPQSKSMAAQPPTVVNKLVATPHSVMAAPAAAAAQPTKAAAAHRGSGLLAIAPDGRSAAFTNPKTRLPVQVKVGDQLPNGETVRSIDLKEGRVVTNAKEYSFE